MNHVTMTASVGSNQQKLLEVEYGAAAVSIQAVVRAAVAQNSGSAEPRSACHIFDYPLNFHRDVWDVVGRYVNSRYSESWLVRKDIECERYISCHCFYLKTKFQIKWAGGRVRGKWGALQACWRRRANAIWLQSCYFIVWLHRMRQNNTLLCNRKFVLGTVLHRKIFANRWMIQRSLEHGSLLCLAVCASLFSGTQGKLHQERSSLHTKVMVPTKLH